MSNYWQLVSVVVLFGVELFLYFLIAEPFLTRIPIQFLPASVSNITHLRYIGYMGGILYGAMQGFRLVVAYSCDEILPV